MQPEQVIAVLLVLAAVFSYVNERFLGISPTIGMLLMSLMVAVPFMVAGHLGWNTGQQEVVAFLDSLDFRRTLMDGMLGFLFFAGALHVQLRTLVHERWEVMLLAIGGIGLGAVLAIGAYGLIRGLREDSSRLLVSLALVTGGGVLARALHVSNPLAMVVAGLMVGWLGDRTMQDSSRHTLGTFWKLVEDVINAVLFLLLGLFVLKNPESIAVIPMLLAIAVVLIGRFVSVAIPIRFWRIRQKPSVAELQLSMLMTWGGLRGAISIALLLSLPTSPQRELLFDMTYAVVVFSLIVQGLTIGHLFTSSQLQQMAELKN